MIAVQYESKNLLFQSSIQLFKNYTKDNLFEKLISDPIITEYIGGEIISSNNKDLSKANTLSLDAFRESVKTKNEKITGGMNLLIMKNTGLTIFLHLHQMDPLLNGFILLV